MKLILDNVVKSFDEKEVIKGATFEFESGYIYGLLGRNGAGKTTLFNLINEDLKVDDGVINIEDEKLRTIEAGDIGYVLSTPIVPDFLTGREFLKFFIDINKGQINDLKTYDEYFDIVELASIMNIRIAMKTNSKINALRNLPVIKRIIPQSLYRSRGLKGFLVAYAWLSEFLLIFLWKMLYYFILVVIAKLIAMEVVENNDYEVLMHFLIFFPVIGMVLNNNTFTADEDTYCSIFVLRINAKKYMLSQYLLDKFDYVFGTLFVGGITICIVMKQPFYMLLCYVLYSQRALAIMKEKNPDMRIGYTPENEMEIKKILQNRR